MKIGVVMIAILAMLTTACEMTVIENNSTYNITNNISIAGSNITNNITYNVTQNITQPGNISSNDTNCIIVTNTTGTTRFRVDCGAGVTYVQKIVPTSTNGYDLGDNTHVWRNATIQTINMNASTTYVACTTGNRGTIIYNMTLNKHMGCNSTMWNALY